MVDVRATTDSAGSAPGVEDLDLRLPERWAIGSMFGGATGAEVVRTLRHIVPAGWAPMAVALRFHRRISPGVHALSVSVPHRGARAVTTDCLVRASGVPAVSALITWGAGESFLGATCAGLRRTPALRPTEPAPGDLSALVDWRLDGPWAPVQAGAETVTQAWIRPRESGWMVRLADRSVLDPAWYLVAADLIGPALVRAGVPLPFRVATVSLDVQTHALTDGPWLRQQLTARMVGPWAVGRLELFSPEDELVATAVQHAAVAPATALELPVAVTGFGWGGRVEK